jgi:hypothetical protein
MADTKPKTSTLGTALKIVGALQEVFTAAGPLAAELKEAFAKKGVTAAEWKALAEEWGQIAEESRREQKATS